MRLPLAALLAAIPGGADGASSYGFLTVLPARTYGRANPESSLILPNKLGTQPVSMWSTASHGNMSSNNTHPVGQPSISILGCDDVVQPSAWHVPPLKPPTVANKATTSNWTRPLLASALDEPANEPLRAVAQLLTLCGAATRHAQRSRHPSTRVCARASSWLLLLHIFDTIVCEYGVYVGFEPAVYGYTRHETSDWDESAWLGDLRRRHILARRARARAERNEQPLTHSPPISPIEDRCTCNRRMTTILLRRQASRVAEHLLGRVRISTLRAGTRRPSIRTNRLPIACLPAPAPRHQSWRLRALPSIAALFVMALGTSPCSPCGCTRGHAHNVANLLLHRQVRVLWLLH